MVSKNLILQKNDDWYSLSEYKTASEGSLHPRPKGQGIRDPLRSHSNKEQSVIIEKFGVKWGFAILVNVPYFGIMNVKKIYFLKKLC